MIKIYQKIKKIINSLPPFFTPKAANQKIQTPTQTDTVSHHLLPTYHNRNNKFKKENVIQIDSQRGVRWKHSVSQSFGNYKQTEHSGNRLYVNPEQDKFIDYHKSYDKALEYLKKNQYCQSAIYVLQKAAINEIKPNTEDQKSITIRLLSLLVELLIFAKKQPEAYKYLLRLSEFTTEDIKNSIQKVPISPFKKSQTLQKFLKTQTIHKTEGIQINFYTANILKYLGRYEDSLQAYSKVIQKYSPITILMSRSYYQRSFLYSFQFLFQDTLVDLSKISFQEDDYQLVLYAKAVNEFRSCEYEDALKKFTYLFQNPPTLILFDDVCLWMINCNRHLMREGRVVSLCTNILKDSTMSQLLVKIYQYRAQALKHLQMYESAYYDDSQILNFNLRAQKSYFQLCKCYIRLGQFELAKKLLKRLQKLNSSRDEIGKMRQRIQLIQDEFPQFYDSMSDKTKIIEQYQIDYRQAVKQFQKHDFSQTLELTHRYRYSLNSQRIHRIRGLCFENIAEYQQSLDSLSKAINIEPSCEAHIRRGMIYFHHQQFQNAFMDFEKAFQNLDLDDFSFSDLGVYLAEGIEKIKTASRNIEMKKQNIFLFLCETYFDIGVGNWDKSIQSIQKILVVQKSKAFEQWLVKQKADIQYKKAENKPAYMISRGDNDIVRFQKSKNR